MPTRHYGRAENQLREWSIEPAPFGAAQGRVLIRAGKTTLLCTASIEEDVPPWMKGEGKGWITAEYNMLPSSVSPRKRRERAKVDGRTTEIQRLIGRSLRAAVDLNALGERSVTVDCEVLEADGGTRTAAITGGYVALAQALLSLDEFTSIEDSPIKESIVAVSVGIVDGQAVLDLDYHEDFAASVDMNVVMTGGGRFVELQGTGEEATFDANQLQSMISLAQTGTRGLSELQEQALAS
ncbi:MAG: ribonuclease PH [Lacipirellulaceae bacterium]